MTYYRIRLQDNQNKNGGTGTSLFWRQSVSLGGSGNEGTELSLASNDLLLGPITGKSKCKWWCRCQFVCLGPVCVSGGSGNRSLQTESK